ncbi:hypothetical protein COMA2_30004 [Candidatus Nitrospira nitrificans]|uniref:Uncharacterized protein n=1 Tax=Candidatus Nitrospira nitrificans TaxID=1742973 RepID=A0A0S4LIA3_9BACT|nr:hypothetical protein COMA2_30004 [Candidatus Nitrospira nitrificans]
MSRILQHALFRFKLGLAVDIDRSGFIGLLIPTGLAVEDFPARQENKGNVPGESSQISRGVHIDTTGYLRIALALCRSTQRRAVDHRVRLETPPNLFGGGMIREIKVGAAEATDLPSRHPSSSGLHEVLPDQPCRPGDDDTWLHSASMGKARGATASGKPLRAPGRYSAVPVYYDAPSMRINLIEDSELYDFRLLVWKMGDGARSLKGLRRIRANIEDPRNEPTIADSHGDGHIGRERERDRHRYSLDYAAFVSVLVGT